MYHLPFILGSLYWSSIFHHPENHSTVMFSKVLGSAVNPVLREGNSDRRAARPVKELAQRTVKRSPAMKPYSKV